MHALYIPAPVREENKKDRHVIGHAAHTDDTRGMSAIQMIIYACIVVMAIFEGDEGVYHGEANIY